MILLKLLKVTVHLQAAWEPTSTPAAPFQAASDLIDAMSLVTEASKMKWQKLQFSERPLGAGSKSKSIPTDPHMNVCNFSRNKHDLSLDTLSFKYGYL